MTNKPIRIAQNENESIGDGGEKGLKKPPSHIGFSLAQSCKLES